MNGAEKKCTRGRRGKGEGAEPGVILKVNSARLSTREAVEKEFYTSRAAKDLGLSVPEAKEMVRVGNAYGTITQLIKPKRSLSRICCDEPARIEEMAQLLCARGKELFATPCNTTIFPSRKQQVTYPAGEAVLCLVHTPAGKGYTTPPGIKKGYPRESGVSQP